MKFYRWFSLLILVFMLGCASSPEKSPAKYADMAHELLIGTWKGTDITGEAGTFVFNADGTAALDSGGVRFDDAMPEYQLVWQLDSSKNPMHLDMVLTDTSGRSVTIVMIAQFLDQDRLKLQKGLDRRPRRFSGDPNLSIVVLRSDP